MRRDLDLIIETSTLVKVRDFINPKFNLLKNLSKSLLYHSQFSLIEVVKLSLISPIGLDIRQ